MEPDFRKALAKGYLPQDVEFFAASIKVTSPRLPDDISDKSIFDAAEFAGLHEPISQLSQGYETQTAIDGDPLSGQQHTMNRAIREP